MPEVSRFYGIVIRMYFADHWPPHFHAEYGEHEAVIGIEDLRVIAGNLPASPTSTLFPMILAKSGRRLTEVACLQCGFLEIGIIVTNYFALSLDTCGFWLYM